MFKRVQIQLGVLLKKVFYSGKSLPKSPIGKKKQFLIIRMNSKLSNPILNYYYFLNFSFPVSTSNVFLIIMKRKKKIHSVFVLIFSCLVFCRMVTHSTVLSKLIFSPSVQFGAGHRRYTVKIHDLVCTRTRLYAHTK
jgi:hypothetical protein